MNNVYRTCEGKFRGTVHVRSVKRFVMELRQVQFELTPNE